MARVGQKIRRSLRRSLSEQQEAILNEFRKRTPGYQGKHVVGEAGIAHVHSGKYVYTYELVQGWRFSEESGRKTVGVVYNAAPHAVLVEFGFMSASGIHMHEGGHRMIESTLRGSNVRQMYGAMAKKALIVALSTEQFGRRKKLGKAQVAVRAVGPKKDGVGVYFRRGRTWVKGAPGAGVKTATLRKLAERFGDSLAAALNTGL